jgi:DNA-binding FadR family transcriptional regulator
MGTTRQDLESNFRPLQIYEQVEEKIKEEIRTGRFAAESRLPSERELAALYGVGRPAVREAIGALQNEGLVVTKRNSGTYVSPAASERLDNGSRISAQRERSKHASSSSQPLHVEPPRGASAIAWLSNTLRRWRRSRISRILSSARCGITATECSTASWP